MAVLNCKEKIMSGCAISGILDKKGRRFNGKKIADSIAVMHERSNGQGAGYAAYGIYPQHRDNYAFHMFFENKMARKEFEELLARYFKINYKEEIVVNKNVKGIRGIPLIWRYFCLPDSDKLEKSGCEDTDYTVDFVMKVNSKLKDTYIFSSGKNMGVFKGVGYPEEIAEFYRLDNYRGYLWTAHGRFPTNTPGWWGGAHPFTLLDRSIVHNGEISSYGANKRYIEMYGYKCTMMTDTEVITYLLDLLLRKQNLPLKIAVKAIAAPLWSEIERMDKNERKIIKTIRTIYSSVLLNGPFSIILGHSKGLVALNDRIKLRPMVVAENEDVMYVASEEAAIRKVCTEPGKIWSPGGGEIVIGSLEKNYTGVQGEVNNHGIKYEKSRVCG